MICVDPATGQELFEVAPATDPVAQLDAARAAQPEWAALGAHARAARLSAAADRIAADTGLADLIVSDVGKPITEARGEVARAAAILRYAAAQATAPAGELFEDTTGASVRVLSFPRGTALLITPWNFPIAIPVWKLAPALATGNAVILKPASQALRVAQRLVEHLDLGAVVQLAPGGAAVAQALLDAGPDAVSFTGSTATGRSIAERLAGRLIPLQLEMGGKNAVFASAAADPALTARVALGGAMGYAGQKCTASSLLYVDAAAHDAVLAELRRQTAALAVGDPRSPDTVVGPMIDRAKRDEVRDLVGGEGTDHAYLQPVLLDGGHATDTEELFAPVLSVAAVDGIDDALARLHANPYGLVSGVVSPLRDEVERWARAVETGIVRVNAPTTGVEPHVPFGGAGASSFGPREQGRAGFAFFTETRTIYG